MNENAVSFEPRRRTGWSTLIIASGVGVLVLTLLAVGVAWLRSHAHLNAQLARIRATGAPVTPPEANAYYRAPAAGRDTTALWLAAIVPLDSSQFQAGGKALPFVGEAPDEIPFPGQPWELLAPSEQFLQTWQGSRDQLHLVARQGGEARFPVDFSAGVSMPLPHLQQLRAAARLLSLECVVAAHRGETEAAVDSAVTMFAAARTIEQEPILVTQLVRMAISSMARLRLQWLLSAGALNDAQLRRLDAELARSDFQQSVQRALIAERTIGIQTFDNPALLGGAVAGGFRLTPASDEIAYLQLMEQMIAALDETGLARRQAVEDAEQQLTLLAGQTGAAIRFPLTRLLLPSLQAFTEATSRNEAQRDATRVAIAIERFYLRYGQLPTSLDDLVPTFLESLLEDPFDGAPLRFRLDAEHYLVYSVGTNGADDGGTSEPANQPPDIVVRVRRKDGAAGARPVEGGGAW